MKIRHCDWCGRFVRHTQQAITGVNWFGDSRTQLLCDECSPHWLQLIEQNKKHLLEVSRT